MRLATVNVLSGRSPDEDHVDVDRFAAATASLDVDVLAMQEVDRDQPRSDRLDLTAVAAEALGARWSRFAPALGGVPGERWSAAHGHVTAGRPAYGVALVSRPPVHWWHVVPLPALGVPVLFRWPGARRPTWVRDEARIALLAGVEGPRGPVTVVTTHLSFLPAWNLVQLAVLQRVLRRRPGALVLTGDLNTGPRPARAVTGCRVVPAPPTYPSDTPVRRIDHVLLRGLEASGPAVARRLPVSDHRALLVDVT